MASHPGSAPRLSYILRSEFTIIRYPLQAEKPMPTDPDGLRALPSTNVFPGLFDGQTRLASRFDRSDREFATRSQPARGIEDSNH